MSTLALNIMDLLKERTTEHHWRAEQSAFQRALIKGAVTREQYARWLGQMMLVHAALEDELAARRDAEPRLAVAADEQFGAPRLRADLLALGQDVNILPLGATSAIAAEIARAAAARPVSLLGFQYVLEGSKNGNRFIAIAIRRGLEIAPGAGDTYLDPYGEQQRAKWQAFRGAMGAQAYDDAETEAILDAACATFDGVNSLSAALAS